MNILRYIILLLVLLNLPMFGLVSFNPTLGALASALQLVALFFYYFFNEKTRPMWSIIILGILYYTIAGLQFSGPISEFFKAFFIYFLFILSIGEVVKKTTTTEVCVILLIGSLSVAVNALMFSDDYGRYAGFYINPNRAGLICVLGFALTYRLSNKKFKLLAQFLFTICGIATLSRYFIAMLVLVNVMSLFANKKNIIGLFAGVIGLVVILSSGAFELNKDRFSALQSIFGGGEVETKTITRESREETWALYTDAVLENVLIGNGYGSMQGNQGDTLGIKVGVHNTYLMVIGESGIIPFLLIIIIYISIGFRSLKFFTTYPEYVYLALILASFLMVSHNYFYNYPVLFMTIWLYMRITDKEAINELNSM